MKQPVVAQDQKILSIICASNRPHNMRAFLDNLKATIAQPDAIEVLVKIDDGDAVMLELLTHAIKTYPFEIRFLQTPKLDGYYTLHHGYQQLLEISDPCTYFILPINEEVRFKTLGWDNQLRNYIGFFSDDMFRLKMSKLKFRNYYSYHDCGPCPENYPIMTRKWMELVEGIGDCWGPDGWHQFIDYHLGVTPGLHHIPGLFRSVPILDIEIGGEEAGRELTPEQIRTRTTRIWQEWWRMFSPALQQTFRRLAYKMFCYAWAEDQGLKDYRIVEDHKKYSMEVFSNEGKKLVSYDYFLAPSYIRYKNFCFLVHHARLSHYNVLQTYIHHHNVSKNSIVRITDRAVRTAIVTLAFIISFFTLDFYSSRRSFIKRTLKRLYYFSVRVMKAIIRSIIGRENAKKLARYARSFRGTNAV